MSNAFFRGLPRACGMSHDAADLSSTAPLPRDWYTMVALAEHRRRHRRKVYASCRSNAGSLLCNKEV